MSASPETEGPGREKEIEDLEPKKTSDDDAEKVVGGATSRPGWSDPPEPEVPVNGISNPVTRLGH
jgi:hypothetical protein